ncbi:MAG TPA: UPF0182 family protein [Segeticoccus sp.]|nr:UPF0182 family protein [Segeticoccus sp.]
MSHEWFGHRGGGGGDAGEGPGGRGPAGPRGPRPGPVRLRRRRGPLGPTIAIVIGLLIAITIATELWTEVLWYSSIGFAGVFRNEILTKVALFVAGGAVTGLLVASSLVVAYRSRPIYAPVTQEQQNLDHYREMLEPLRKLAFVALPVVVGLFAGGAAAAQWKTALLWLNGQPFGTEDAQFHIDIGFFVFTLPWLRFLVGYLTMSLVLAIIAAALTHYVYGGLQLQAKGQRTTKAARVHLCVLLAAIVLVRAASYWLDRYDLTTHSNDFMTGITYTDVHAVLPSKAILSVIAILCAAMFLATIWTRSWRIPLVGLSLLLVCAIVIGGIYPALVQGLKVNPSELSLEKPYISKNIKATRAAYDIADTKVRPYDAVTTASEGQLRNDAETIPGIRLVDPSLVTPTFKQLQAFKSYYQFPDSLDVDRYDINGKTQDTVIAVRGMDLAGIPGGGRNWINEHTVYTHGFGVVAAYGNKRGRDGQPVFFEKGMPPKGPLGDFQARVYFGETLDTFSIVGGPKGGPRHELDYPNQSDAGQQNNTYQGDGGVAMGSLLRQLAYGIKFRDLKILLTDRVNPDSKIIYDRTPRERVEKVAPWLKLDGNPYPAVVDGKIQWIIDGYTTSSHYPYSSMKSIGSATEDSLTQRTSSVQAIQAGQVNYIRNSVKATVDAYSGEVHLYAWDNDDPILKAWSNAFPGTVEPMSHISSDLMQHLRYPEDLFKVQREVISKYHVTDPSAFYNKSDFWKVPNDPTQEQTEVSQPPYYLSLAMPGQKTPQFSLTTPFMPIGDRNVLSGFLAVDANAGDKAGSPRDDYGTLRLLELPRDTSVKGPGQFQNDIESSNVNTDAYTQTLSQFLSLNRQQGSDVELGNLLTLPVGGGMLYVEPIYVSAKGNTSYPLSRAIVVGFGNQLAWSDTLEKALDQLFGGNSGAVAGDAGSSPGSSPEQGTEGGKQKSEGKGQGGANPQLDQALADIQQAYEDGQQALKDGDFAAYGDAQKRLEEAIKRAVAAEPEGGSVSVPGTPAPTPSGSSGSSSK